MRLVSVYDYPNAIPFLYGLLAERDEVSSISHRRMPTQAEHASFVLSYPYEVWYIIVLEDSDPDDDPGEDAIGAIYLTRNNEIGVFVLKELQGTGVGSWALDELIRLHPRDRYLANINPQNVRSRMLFHKKNFVHISNTYELRIAR